MANLVHIAPENISSRIRRVGLQPRRLSAGSVAGVDDDRVVWAFPVLQSYTLTLSWARELKRTGAKTLVAVAFKIADGERVYCRHFSSPAVEMSAAEAVGVIRAATDARGYVVMVPRRIEAREIQGIKVLPKAIGWRYWPEAKNKPLRLCECPMCMPRGEVKAARYRARVRTAMAEDEQIER